MYGDYFLDYASYVILERAVPHINDGFTPVQRRILHAMDKLDDGRFNKVANIVGDTMKYHPHGDMSIGSALVNLGQKNILIETQGNWGNILTGDPAAAARYIEARLSKLAKDLVFSPKVTEWKLSYDGRNKEPITFPVKFPLLLAQGAFGIAVGLSCEIMPHNFNEIITGAIAYLRGEEFTLYPDFPTGGIMDISDYKDGVNGRLRCRARIVIENKKLIRVTEVPFGTTTDTLIKSIVKASEQGKIKIVKIEDNTAQNADILVHLPPGSDPEQTEQALYAFTCCQMGLSPKACVIMDDKPQFLGVSEILRHNVDFTKDILRREQEFLLGELQQAWHDVSLERIFITNRIYKVLEDSESWENSLKEIEEALQPFIQHLWGSVTKEDIIRLTEIKLRKIAKYEVFESDKQLKSLEDQIEATKKNLAQLTKFTIKWFEGLRKKYSHLFPRKTDIAEFSTAKRSDVAVENETLYMDEEGFAGYGLKKADAIDKCSMLSDILIIDANGVLKITKVQDKFFVGKKPLYIKTLRPDDDPVFNLIYRDGKEGTLFAKRFRIGGFTRDKEYPLTQETKGSRLFFFSDHKTEEESAAISVNVYIKSKLRLKTKPSIYDFSKLRIKNRSSLGNIVTKNQVERISRIMTIAANPETPMDADPAPIAPVDTTSIPEQDITPTEHKPTVEDTFTQSHFNLDIEE